MTRILLNNIGCLKNKGIGMMLKAITTNIDADFYYHKLTICGGYKNYSIRGSWKCWGYDMALDLGGDTFTTYYGFRQFIRHSLHLFKLWVFRQPYALFAQTFSDYGWLTKWIALFFMKRAAFISVREKRSFDLLQSMGIRCHLAADITFLLDSWDSDPYFGGSYHRIIAAKLSGYPGEWDGSRDENFKFDIFKEPLDLKIMKKKAGLNIALLQRVFSD